MQLIRLFTALVVVALTMAPVHAADSWSVVSPDGSVTFELLLADAGALSYRVRLGAGSDRTDVIAWSHLGVTRADQAFVTGLRPASRTAARAVDESYTTLHGKRSAVRHRANEAVFSFTNAAGAPLDLIVRATDDGAAFRYRFPNTDATIRRVTGETTEFVAVPGARSWIAPRSPAGKYTPAYEDLYLDHPAGTPSPLAGGWDFPALFNAGGGANCTRSPAPDARGSSCSAAELIAKTAGSGARTVASSCPP